MESLGRQRQMNQQQGGGLGEKIINAIQHGDTLRAQEAEAILRAHEDSNRKTEERIRATLKNQNTPR